MKKLTKYIPLLLIIITIAWVLHNHFLDYFSIKYISHHKHEIWRYYHEHFFNALLFYMLATIILVACGLPVLLFMNLIAGFLFGVTFGTILATLCATIGTTILYYAIKLVFGSWAEKKFEGKLPSIAKEIDKNAFTYLMILRFIPILPFEVTTILAAVMNIPARIFFLSTFIGMIPGTIIWTYIGSHLGKMIKSDTLTFNEFTSPSIIIPLLLLALLALLPIIYKKIRQKRQLPPSE